ncbi:hypothetical protein [Cellulomonas soli]|uniref:Uncharacterized protein n=1 Tax=Cellulomonas soli TaxID=931535 RepID=A0A512PI82_9CELL|nr:hypothetical protein [Cellulomonas soli]NYI58778.1 hypothetical protein [Cellulomonas soli]GEP70842.1 hypothetical protein CSO01_35570 [Cellulomonas soli]
MTARAVVRACVRPLLVGAVVAGAAAAFGLKGGSALVVGVLGALAVVAAARVDARPDLAPERVPAPPRTGARGDVQDLAWSMVGRDGRIGERPLRALRAAATTRIARHGLRLTAPEDAAAVRALLGERAYRTLTWTVSPLPPVRDVRHALDVLERLDPPRTTAAITSATTSERSTR